MTLKGHLTKVTNIYAMQNKIPFGALKNSEGNFIAPSLEGSRYLYLPAMGWALAVGLIAGGKAGDDGAQSSRLRPAMQVVCLVMIVAIVNDCQAWRPFDEASRPTSTRTPSNRRSANLPPASPSLRRARRPAS